ncbi:DNA helicase-2 / ATP-dependent DNA helicase PcrA [Paenibacillus sp. UNC496MF]|uniref:ATP-dependent helicase n=1 Tax=Paenibacillus sp. UNC496MF TaxID=1502753 RepID=UPI0008F22209|nr:ATP-dependent helicase [Paenibacillus sp. UNC496MF]SFJ63943.1 DNA helicase-2 / ATP-dependent DNA helicase PcrA [Paenibacillus sp. UNC496MF]
MAIEQQNVISMHQVQALLNELNPMQRQAAEALYGPVLVLAGAGSGKTKTLTYRIANMLAHGIPSSDMFVATFTNKAAREMKERIAKAVGEENVKGLWMGTFHSLCVRILRRHGHYLGYDSSFSIYDTSDSLNMIERIYKIMKIDEKYKPGLALYYMDNAKNNLALPDWCMLHMAQTPQDEVMAIVYDNYQRMMKEANAMDFGDLIMNVVYLMETNQTVRDYWQNKFKFVYSDEYQDSNHAQFRLLLNLAFPHNNLFVVGDHRQSIYKFRGADVRNILQFEIQYPGAQLINLNQNYRSTQVIVHAGNVIHRNNSVQKGEELFTEAETGQKIVIAKNENETKEAAFIAYMIQKKVKEGRKYSDFAILYRANSQSAPFEQLFMHNMIPYKVVGGTGFFQREEIKDVVAYLRVMHNRKDDSALLRILNKPARGIGDTSQNHITAYADTQKVSVYRALKAVDSIPEIKKAAATKIKDFLDLIEKLHERQTGDILKFVRTVVEMSGYWNMWASKPNKEHEERLQNIEEFFRLVERYKTENEGKTLADFLQEISLLMDFEDGKADNAVRLMSMHASKGLEFPVVFISGCVEGVFPSWRSQEQEDLEEERRLAYVGITRAEKELFMTHTEKRTHFRGGMQACEPSRFLNELPQEIVQNIDLSAKKS